MKLRDSRWAKALMRLLALGSAGGRGSAGAGDRSGTVPGEFKPVSEDVASVTGYPAVGKWMYSPDMAAADWLGMPYEGKKLREPINVILADRAAGSADAAQARFLAACAAAGFASRSGHSSGYAGWLGDRLYPQIPVEKFHAISDEPFELHNNPGRFFGPHPWNGGYVIVGAMSREKVHAEPKPEHLYVSFNQARDKFAWAMDKKTQFRITGFVSLGNAILGDPKVGTGDHDGLAVILTAAK